MSKSKCHYKKIILSLGQFRSFSSNSRIVRVNSQRWQQILFKITHLALIYGKFYFFTHWKAIKCGFNNGAISILFCSKSPIIPLKNNFFTLNYAVCCKLNQLLALPRLRIKKKLCSYFLQLCLSMLRL